MPAIITTLIRSSLGSKQRMNEIFYNDTFRVILDGSTNGKNKSKIFIFLPIALGIIGMVIVSIILCSQSNTDNSIDNNIVVNKTEGNTLPNEINEDIQETANKLDMNIMIYLGDDSKRKRCDQKKTHLKLY